MKARQACISGMYITCPLHEDFLSDLVNWDPVDE